MPLPRAHAAGPRRARCRYPEGRWRASRRGLCMRVRCGDDAPIRLGEPPRRLQYRLPSRRSAWMAGCACPCRALLTWDLRCRPSRSGRALESSWLQGLAPPTSPLPPATVAGDEALVPPMGFVPLQGPPTSAPARHSSGKRTAHSRGVACAPGVEGTVVRSLGAREASLRGFPLCDGVSRSTRRGEVAVANPPCAFSARQRDLTPRPGVPPVAG